MLFMIQKEVAENIVAKAGEEAYGRLSVMVQYHCQADILFLVKPGAFTPPPKVDSAIKLLEGGLRLLDLGFALVELGVVDGDLGYGLVAGVEGGKVFLVGVVHGLLGEDALLLHLEGAMVGVLEHGEVGSFGGDLIEGDSGGGGVGAGFGCGELGFLRGDLIENLFLVELGEDLALAHGVVDVGVELGDDAAGLGLDLDFGDGLNLAGGDDRARDIAVSTVPSWEGSSGGDPPRDLAARKPPPATTQTTTARMIQRRLRDFDFDFKGSPKP